MDLVEVVTSHQLNIPARGLGQGIYRRFGPYMVFHTPVASGVQRILQFPPSLKTEAPLGSRGVGSALTRKGATKRRAERTEASMLQDGSGG